MTEKEEKIIGERGSKRERRNRKKEKERTLTKK